MATTAPWLFAECHPQTTEPLGKSALARNISITGELRVNADFTYSTSYNLGMAKHVYIQIKGVEKAIKLKADKVERQTTTGTIVKSILSVSLGEQQVGEFSSDSVDGWWVQDDQPTQI